MQKIKISKDKEKIKIPMGVYVNGFIIEAPMCTQRKSVVQSNNTTSTPTTKEKHNGNA